MKRSGMSSATASGYLSAARGRSALISLVLLVLDDTSSKMFNPLN